MGRASPLDKFLTGFRLHCVAEGKSPRTVEWYEHKLGIFARYLKREQGLDDVTEVEAMHVRAFLAHLREDVRKGDLNPYKPPSDQPISPSTIQGYYRAIKAFFSWLVREEYLEKSPLSKIRRPKVPQTVVKTFSAEQVRRLLAVPDRRRAVGFRDYCTMLLLLDTGIRLGELERLRLADLHLEPGYIQVRGKGAKERLVPIGRRVQKALWRYIAKYRPEPAYPEIDNVFLQGNGRPISGRGIYNMIVRKGKEAGIEQVRCSPHTFRHTFAVTFLRNGGDVFSLRRILGHTSLVVTQMYCHLADSDIHDQHRRYGPVDRLGL